MQLNLQSATLGPTELFTSGEDFGYTELDIAHYVRICAVCAMLSRWYYVVARSVLVMYSIFSTPDS